MNIRMIGFDLDGTLLTTDKILTERTKKALEAAADQGVILVPATGRPLCGLPKELLELPFIKYAVTANGARILETKTEQVLSEMLISVEKAREILDIFSDYVHYEMCITMESVTQRKRSLSIFRTMS